MEQLTLLLFEELEKEVKDTVPIFRKNVLLIDGNNLLNRCYHATAINPDKLQKSSDGRYTNGVNGFLKSLLKYRHTLDITHMGIFFDEGRGFRKELYPDYKANRGETVAPLKEQFQLLKEKLTLMGLNLFCDSYYEADDLIASMVEKLKDDQVYLLSNDKDLLQLVSENCIQIIRSGRNDVFYNSETFREKYGGLEPKQIVDIKALMGDDSDNLIGVPGIGEKGANKLIKYYGSVEAMVEGMKSGDIPKELYRYKKLIDLNEENALFFKRLTLLVKEAKVDANNLSKSIKKDEFMKTCEELGFTDLKRSIERGMYKL